MFRPLLTTQMTMNPKALILHANGTNRDRDVAHALQLAGANPEIVHINQLRRAERQLADYHMLIAPGGFSYGDALGAGRLFALDLQTFFAEQVTAFVASGKPVLGICNGFQVLVKAGILPAGNFSATLTHNQRGHFECRWVHLLPQSSQCVWIRTGDAPLQCPVAHGEGRFVCEDAPALASQQQIALRYALPDGTPANGQYPANPNGSVLDIAGVCNPSGNVLGLMPHPENHIWLHQHPNWTRASANGLALSLFQNGVRYANQC
ncbi:MAG TPA: phosphoribosylformylglycinamidine synthase I [Anaerolineales bacterium]|nr:phosphoribosylformylglycinamidine synthase I [Anaerolineales bacterium]